ncbi:MAG: ArsR family transcriptional regulator [Neptuniibacter sp. Phe_28]|nr:MAG: ArsR family transcriptional regulator [Neptuniibacter sp. Phe_28]
MELDETDYKILHHLQNNGRISNAELADRVALSPSPCLRRVKLLEERGIIERYVAIVNPKLIGLPVNVVISVSLQSQEQSQLKVFQQRIAECEEVMECYLMTGGSDYMLRVVVPDIEHFEHFLVDKLTSIPGISNIQSSFALKQLVYRTELPIKR